MEWKKSNFLRGGTAPAGRSSSPLFDVPDHNEHDKFPVISINSNDEGFLFGGSSALDRSRTFGDASSKTRRTATSPKNEACNNVLPPSVSKKLSSEQMERAARLMKLYGVRGTQPRSHKSPEIPAGQKGRNSYEPSFASSWFANYESVKSSNTQNNHAFHNTGSSSAIPNHISPSSTNSFPFNNSTNSNIPSQQASSFNRSTSPTFLANSQRGHTASRRPFRNPPLASHSLNNNSNNVNSNNNSSTAQTRDNDFNKWNSNLIPPSQNIAKHNRYLGSPPQIKHQAVSGLHEDAQIEEHLERPPARRVAMPLDLFGPLTSQSLNSRGFSRHAAPNVTASSSSRPPRVPGKIYSPYNSHIKSSNNINGSHSFKSHDGEDEELFSLHDNENDEIDGGYSRGDYQQVRPPTRQSDFPLLQGLETMGVPTTFLKKKRDLSNENNKLMRRRDDVGAIQHDGKGIKRSHITINSRSASSGEGSSKRFPSPTVVMSNNNNNNNNSNGIKSLNNPRQNQNNYRNLNASSIIPPSERKSNNLSLPLSPLMSPSRPVSSFDSNPSKHVHVATKSVPSEKLSSMGSMGLNEDVLTDPNFVLDRKTKLSEEDEDEETLNALTSTYGEVSLMNLNNRPNSRNANPMNNNSQLIELQDKESEYTLQRWKDEICGDSDEDESDEEVDNHHNSIDNFINEENDAVYTEEMLLEKELHIFQLSPHQNSVFPNENDTPSLQEDRPSTANTSRRNKDLKGLTTCDTVTTAIHDSGAGLHLLKNTKTNNTAENFVISSNNSTTSVQNIRLINSSLEINQPTIQFQTGNKNNLLSNPINSPIVEDPIPLSSKNSFLSTCSAEEEEGAYPDDFHQSESDVNLSAGIATIKHKIEDSKDIKSINPSQPQLQSQQKQKNISVDVSKDFPPSFLYMPPSKTSGTPPAFYHSKSNSRNYHDGSAGQAVNFSTSSSSLNPSIDHIDASRSILPRQVSDRSGDAHHQMENNFKEGNENVEIDHHQQAMQRWAMEICGDRSDEEDIVCVHSDVTYGLEIDNTANENRRRIDEQLKFESAHKKQELNGLLETLIVNENQSRSNHFNDKNDRTAAKKVNRLHEAGPLVIDINALRNTSLRKQQKQNPNDSAQSKTHRNIQGNLVSQTVNERKQKLQERLLQERLLLHSINKPNSKNNSSSSPFRHQKLINSDNQRNESKNSQMKSKMNSQMTAQAAIATLRIYEAEQQLEELNCDVEDLEMETLGPAVILLNDGDEDESIAHIPGGNVDFKTELDSSFLALFGQ